MRLKADVNVTEFIRQVERCSQDVFLQTEEDNLNLKSTLSQYVFVVIEENPGVRGKAQVVCEDEADYELLGAYLEA